MSRFHSGMFGSGDAADRGHEGLPRAALRLQHFLPFGRQFVIAPPPLPGLLHPLPLNPAPLLKPVEQRIERCDMETQRPARTGLDQFGNVVAVPGPDLDEREDQQLGAALLQFASKIRVFIFVIATYYADSYTASMGGRFRGKFRPAQVACVYPMFNRANF